MTTTKNLLEGRTGPISQSIDAVKSLLQWKKIASDPLPADVSMDSGRLVLVKSNKGDVFYTVTAKVCSCPSATYHPDQPCKHRRQYFGAKLEQVATVAESGSIRPECKWPGNLNGPVDEPIKAVV
jgi:hypothetical protein